MDDLLGEHYRLGVLINEAKLPSALVKMQRTLVGSRVGLRANDTLLTSAQREKTTRSRPSAQTRALASPTVSET